MNVLPAPRALLVLLSAVIALGCNRGAPNPSPPAGAPARPAAGGPALTIRENDSPAGTDSREPELHPAADGRRVLLSWVEKVGGKRYSLRFAARDERGWSEA